MRSVVRKVTRVMTRNTICSVVYANSHSGTFISRSELVSIALILSETKALWIPFLLLSRLDLLHRDIMSGCPRRQWHKGVLSLSLLVVLHSNSTTCFGRPPWLSLFCFFCSLFWVVCGVVALMFPCWRPLGCAFQIQIFVALISCLYIYICNCYNYSYSVALISKLRLPSERQIKNFIWKIFCFH